MSTTVIVVNESGVIKVANLSHEFISHLSEMVNETKKSKTRKPRKTRDWTDEERDAFRARMMAGREAKALAESKPKVVRKKNPLTKLEEEISRNSTKVLESLDSKVQIPRTGLKVEVNPAAE